MKRASTKQIFDYTILSLFFIMCIGAAPLRAEENANLFPRIAVLYFQNNSTDNHALNALSKGLCSMMITDMKSAGGYTVVERERIQAVLAELEMAQGAAFDSATASKIGRLVGAEYLVFGSYFELFDKFTINARMVIVETGVIAGASGVCGRSTDFDQLQQQLTFDLLGKMNPLFCKFDSDVLRGSDVKTRVSVADAVEYGQALDEHDQGRNYSARKILLDIVEANPRFDAARTMLAQLASD